MADNSYAAAGVDTEAGDRAVELMKSAVARTMTPDVFGTMGGFAGMVDVSVLKDYKRPLLATSTDGVGTKIAIAQAMDVHDTIGQDLVGMVVDDIVVVGARPLLMTDYIACGRVVPERIADIVRGVAQACEAVGVPLLGGETAEHPGVMAPDDYDIAGAATGVVDADKILGPERVADGDVLLALAASGLHSNGFSLVRKIVSDAGWSLDREVAEFGRTLGEELLEPTRLYTKVCLDIAAATEVHAYSHITGGGLGANMARVVPAGKLAVLDRGTWQVPAVFQVLVAQAGIDWTDVEDTLNLGVGMVAALPESSVEAATKIAQAAGIDAWVIGRVGGSEPEGAKVIQGTKGVDGGRVALVGNHRL